jgi:translation initiation factor IF-1
MIGELMGRDDLLKVNAVVTDALSGSTFRVKLDDGKILVAKLSGRLRRFHIRVLVGDRVTLGLSPYDLTHGLILSREKLDNPFRQKKF